MKNITDRIDARIQLRLLADLLKRVFELDVKTSKRIYLALMVLIGPDRSIHYPQSKDKRKDLLQFSVGQGMGTNVSIPLAAIVHHMIVRISAIQVRKNLDYTDYCVLGDDLVIGHKDVATQYLHNMQSLGVECSIPKSIGLVATASGLLTEIAKRNLYAFGDEVIEITPLTPSILSLGIVPTLMDLIRKDAGAHLSPGHLLMLWAQVDPKGSIVRLLKLVVLSLSLPVSRAQRGIHLNGLKAPDISVLVSKDILIKVSNLLLEDYFGKVGGLLHGIKKLSPCGETLVST